jgi:hypothetical protein
MRMKTFGLVKQKGLSPPLSVRRKAISHRPCFNGGSVSRTLLLIYFLLQPGGVLADAGIATHMNDPSKDPNGMSAKTFFELLDASLGDRFNSLVLVFGGCFTSDFTAKAKTSTVGTSGKPVAVLAATDENDTTQFAGGNQIGAAFTGGVADKLGEDGSTIQDAFKLGKWRVNLCGAEGQTPTFTSLNGGADIKPGNDASSYHAILFVGVPTQCSDWNDLAKTYQALLERGYPPQNIECYFGRGERAGQATDDTPVLSKQDYTQGSSVNQEFEEGNCPGFSDQGQRLKLATCENLKKALENLKTIADAGKNEQYFLWFADHSTLLALGTPSSRFCDGTAPCSVRVDMPWMYLTMPVTAPMEVIVRPLGIVSSNHTVVLNGYVLGQLDPRFDKELQFFPIRVGLVLAGTNEIVVDTTKASLTIQDVAITTGCVPVQPGLPFLEITRSGTHLILQWPYPASGFVLQTTASLGAGSIWSNVLGEAVIAHGYYRITIANRATTGFFRLAKP